MTNEPDELSWAAVARLRQGLYRFFSAAFLAPERPRMAGLLAGAELLDGAGIDAFAFFGSWAALRETMRTLPPFEKVREDYTELFVSGRDGPLCPPVESFYVDRARRNNVPATVARIESQYRNLGLQLAPGAAPTPDHVATELEALAILCARESAAWASEAFSEVARNLGFESAFLRQHLGRWIARFRRNVAREATPGFYADVAAAAAAFVHHDEQLVRLVVQEQRHREAV